MVGVRLRRRCVSGLKSWTTLAWCAVFSKPQVSHWWWWWSQTPFLSRRLKPCQPKQRSVEILCIFGPLDVVSCSNNKFSSFGSLFNPVCFFKQQLPGPCLDFHCLYSQIQDMVAIRHTACNEQQRTTMILLCEDGSLRIYMANVENTSYWLQPSLQPSSVISIMKPVRKRKAAAISKGLLLYLMQASSGKYKHEDWSTSCRYLRHSLLIITSLPQG